MQNAPPENSFIREVTDGLSTYPKSLSSKYFYDDRGDELFEKIMELPEYYLSRSERSILSSGDPVAALPDFPEGLDLIELGAGNGVKTRFILEQLNDRAIEYTYHPVDISTHALEVLQGNLTDDLPDLDLKPRVSTYEEALGELSSFSDRPKIILFLGSNIGNLLHDEAVQFLREISGAMGRDDLLLMGMDLKKDPDVILAAYDDEEGITAAFNKNILYRINRELEADFSVKEFRHAPTYDPETGTLKSYLLSAKAQTVHIQALDMEVSFHPWETIHTEISQKYNRPVIEWLCEESGLQIRNFFTGQREYFADVLMEKES